MRPLADELAELELAVDELRAAIAAPLRELAVVALLVLTTRRPLIVAIAVAIAVALFGWFLLELERSIRT